METLGNLSHLPESVIDLIRRSLQGETLMPVGQTFEITRSRSHCHVQAVALAMQRLGLSAVLGGRSCPEQDRVRAHILLCMLAYYVEWHIASTRCLRTPGQTAAHGRAASPPTRV